MTIFDTILKNRNGHYVHALEVGTAYEIECTIEAIAMEFQEHTKDDLKEFFNSMQIMYYVENEEDENEEDENEVHNFDIDTFINCLN